MNLADAAYQRFERLVASEWASPIVANYNNLFSVCKDETLFSALQ